MIKLIKPYIELEEIQSDLLKIFESGMFTKGEFVSKFCDSLIEFTKVKHAFLTTSATTALTMCLDLLMIGEGDEVIVSDFSFPASVNVIEDKGAIPIFADVCLNSFNSPVQSIEKLVTKKTKAIIYVDALGNPTGLEELYKFSNSFNIPLIEDAACALGSSINNKKCGNIADLTVFSFHPRKLITTGEGGAILTNNEYYSERLKIKLNHGAIFRENTLDFVDFGFNYRMSEIQACMGFHQIPKLDIIINERNEIRDKYKTRLEKLGFQIQSLGANVKHNVQSLVFLIPEKFNRDQLIYNLKNKNIESTLGTYSLSNTTYYKKKYNTNCSNSLKLQKHTLTLPCYKGVDVDYICDSIQEIIK
jgi:perosamine synthetase